MQYTNNTSISLALAVWLMHDDYDYINEVKYISVTTLMKPLRQIILPSRVPMELRTCDVADFIPSALGHSIHASIEKAWTDDKARTTSLLRLGYPKNVIDRVVINPTSEQLAAKPDIIPIYLEQRAKKVISGWTVGGKFDMVAEGIVHDAKSTSAWVGMYGDRDEEHQLQGSFYRLLNPEKITEEFIRIEYIFTDWQKFMARQNPNYPQQRVASKDIPLLDITETEKWAENKLALIEKYMDKPEKELPLCTPEELWMSDPKFKYFADPTKLTRSTKNFDNLIEAREFMASKGNKGIIQTVPGEPKRCDFCAGFAACTQKDGFEKYQTS